MARARYDLHLHSTASDGTLRPREVVALAAERGLAGIALTDHDTTAGVAEAQGMASALGLRCIAGVELSCTTEGAQLVHLLGYFVDPEEPRLLSLFDRMREQREERAQEIVERLRALGAAVTYTDVLQESGEAPPGRPHIARAMVRCGVIREVEDAFTEAWFGPGGRAWVERDGVPIDEAIAAVHGAGGAAVFAHPGARSADGVREIAVRHAATHGLDGIEVDHPDHDGDAVRRCVDLASELGLVQTAGSDDHGGEASRSRLGCRTATDSAVTRLEHRALAYRIRV